MRKTIVLKKGERAVLRFLTRGDSPKKFAEFINPIIRERNFILLDKPVSLAEEKKWFEEQLKQVSEGDLIFLAVEKAGKIVGAGEVRRGRWKEKRNAELAVTLSRRIRGMGLGKVLLLELISLAKAKFKPRIIFLKCFGSNEVALSLYRRVGFKEVARLPNWFNHYGELEDCVFLYLGSASGLH